LFPLQLGQVSFFTIVGTPVGRLCRTRTTFQISVSGAAQMRPRAEEHGPPHAILLVNTRITGSTKTPAPTGLHTTGARKVRLGSRTTSRTSSALARAALLVALATVMAAVGCAQEPEPATSGAGSDMMGGSEAGMVAGVIASARETALDPGAGIVTRGGIVVPRVLAPDDCWLVVRSTVAPGGVLGTARVTKGEHRDVPVMLTAADSARVRIALHADRGERGAFEFDADRPSYSLDKPVIVEGRPVEGEVALQGWGVESLPAFALLEAEDQTLSGGAVRIRYLLVPGASWVSVNLVEGGVPGTRVGLLSRSGGEWQELLVPVEGVTPPAELVVTVYADRGEAGVFDFKPADPLASKDQPYTAAGLVVSHRIRVE